jgi:hypothetical protein
MALERRGIERCAVGCVPRRITVQRSSRVWAAAEGVRVASRQGRESCGHCERRLDVGSDPDRRGVTVVVAGRSVRYQDAFAVLDAIGWVRPADPPASVDVAITPGSRTSGGSVA